MVDLEEAIVPDPVDRQLRQAFRRRTDEVRGRLVDLGIKAAICKSFPAQRSQVQDDVEMAVGLALEACLSHLLDAARESFNWFEY